MTKIYCLGASALLIALIGLTPAAAQGPGVVSGPPATQQSAPLQPPGPAPAAFKAKYEGGVFGYNKRMNGTLTLDDVNKRILFRNKDQVGIFSIPYAAIVSEYGDKQARRPAAATVVSSVPVPYGLNLPAYFIKKKYQYLTLQYNDPDTKVSGITSFKLENKEMLTSAVSSIAGRSGLSLRGQVYVKTPDNTATTQPTSPD